MESKTISQKEYLKKYISLGNGDEKKKKKKKKLKTGTKTVKVIDDDIDLKNMRPIEEGEFDILLEGEDAPQIAGIVDERGPVDFTDKRRWKIITENEEGNLTIINRPNKEGRNQDEMNVEQNENDNLDLSPPRSKHSKNKQIDSNLHKRFKNDDSDLTPPRVRHSKDKRIDLSPRRRHKGDDLDLSPPRLKHSKKKHVDLSPHGRFKDDDSDLSPPRVSHSKDKRIDSNPCRRRKDDNSDLSPPRVRHSKDKRIDSSPRRRRKDDDSDPPRLKHSKDKHIDLSPRRRHKDDDSDLSPPRFKHSKDKHIDLSPRRRHKDDDSDLSPPRQSTNNNSSPVRQSKNYNSDASPPRRITKHRTSNYNMSERKYRSLGDRDSDSDFSPPRKRKQKLDTDLYESRKNKNRDLDLDTSRRKEHRSQRDNSLYSSSRRVDKEYNYYDKNSSRLSRQDVPRSNRDKSEREYEDRDRKSRSYADTNERRKKSRWNDETDDFEREYSESHSRDRNDRMTKTLDGKTAGLQDAKALREETEAFKRREIEQFNKLSKTVSGVGQAPIMRDKTGRKRNLEAEAAEKREREARQLEIDEKYNKWGKGLKQVEDREEKLKDDLYEMNKPLARYADDADLDKQLREQEREGDPMLEYIKQKQIKEGKRQPEQLQYQGSYAPNRFGIKPGHRWDGVDRSNGYEKKWFETQNAKVARQEDAYKWSTSDM